MRWVAYMPLRGGSKSIPGKNVRELSGRPLFAWALGEAVASDCFDAVWVGTDSDDIARAVNREFGEQVAVFRRGPDTCTDEASTESALLEFAAAEAFDVLCTIQATAPLTRADDFRAARAQFEAAAADSLVTATREKRFYWSPAGEPLNYDPVRRPRRQDFAGTLVENGAFYYTRRPVLEELQCRLGGTISVYEMAPETAIEIDEPADWTLIEAMLGQSGRPASPATGIRALVVDVDGTLTDGGMYYGADGEALKKFNTRDAKGLKRLEQAGYRVAVMTQETSEAVHARMRKLEIDDYLPGTVDKLPALEALVGRWGLGLDEVAYVGDDLNDQACLEAVGFACCPADAEEPIRNIAHYVARAPGGGGAVREVCERLLAARGRDQDRDQDRDR
ncbi:N-acylneuraminate cytidylyltransferase [Elongatibacter sediminis]|uniref:3-deoxy-D-manno-octulosonate 8-phosphate phosphatase KdsC n=1 Tax=Elongatibacter sediminis TaxID=3119006 RepID=A0AAW9RH64_9GAMM